MKNLNRSDKEKLWRSRLEMAAQFSGSNREFCISQGIPIPTFQYWKAKLSSGRLLNEKAIASAFVKVEIEDPSVDLPDPRWLAELILSLSRGQRTRVRR